LGFSFRFWMPPDLLLLDFSDAESALCHIEIQGSSHGAGIPLGHWLEAPSKWTPWYLVGAWGLWRMLGICPRLSLCTEKSASWMGLQVK
jgi:hypothetical protein